MSVVRSRPDRRAGLGLAAAVAFGCVWSSAPPPAPDVVPGDTAYVIGAADELQIRVWKNPELSVTAPVRPDGKISVPLLDDVQAAGLTALELKELVTRELGEYVSNPDVTVVVTSMLSKRAYVIGAVGRSGPISLATDMRILDAIAASGGFSPFADKKRIKILRRGEGGDEEYGFNYDAFVAGKAPGTNILLLPGDTIVVPD